LKNNEKRLLELEKSLRELRKGFDEWNKTFRHFSEMVEETSNSPEGTFCDTEIKMVSGSSPEELQNKIQKLEREGFYLSDVKTESGEFFRSETYIMRRPLRWKWQK